MDKEINILLIKRIKEEIDKAKIRLEELEHQVVKLEKEFC